MRKEDKPFFDALEDWQILGLNIEREAGGEPREGRIAVGTVTLERVDHRKWDGNTIHEVILWPWQFSWTMPEAGEKYYNESVRIAKIFDTFFVNDKVMMECCAIAKGMIDGDIPRDPDLAAVNCCQYLNPVTAKATRDKWIKAGMKSIKVIGRHEFFMEF
jgi:hypothetical protein